ncbi:MAG: hypothetical protein GDA43_26055 [Hormoscilla sp. SP5CHS1]|nr:hypothetical protein [Hormoscilla sp. SP12CHS1]MBC6456193.1 hypothetical protein [Hormoscilla sp. SP5CHS1]
MPVTENHLSEEMLPIEDAPESFSKLYVFGDSLSDPGNQLRVTTFVQPLEPTLGIDFPIDPPTPPYFQGRYSNGPIWVEYLAEGLGITVTPSSELSVLYPRRPMPSPITVTRNGPIVSPFFNGTLNDNSVNFSFGGSQTGTAGSGEFGAFIPGVLKQVNWFRRDLALEGVRADSEALYIMWAGPNDYQSVPTPVPLFSAGESVGNIERALSALYNLGARNFLVNPGRNNYSVQEKSIYFLITDNIKSTFRLVFLQSLENLSENRIFLYFFYTGHTTFNKESI